MDDTMAKTKDDYMVNGCVFGFIPAIWTAAWLFHKWPVFEGDANILRWWSFPWCITIIAIAIAVVAIFGLIGGLVWEMRKKRLEKGS